MAKYFAKQFNVSQLPGYAEARVKYVESFGAVLTLKVFTNETKEKTISKVYFTLSSCENLVNAGNYIDDFIKVRTGEQSP